MYYVLSVGTNIGNKKENIDGVIEALNHLIDTTVVSVSPIYETAPIGYDEQDNFYNVAMLIKSNFEPNEMLGICMGIEATFGRVREFKNGPRIIDIDIILAENKIINTKNLTVPHKEFMNRRFVLQPMKDIFVDGIAFGIDFNEYLYETSNQEIKKLIK